MNKNNNNKSFNYLKGIATFIIIFTHIDRITNPIIKIISNLGYIAVSIFFSISGSLLVEKFITTENYEKKFITKKLKRIYLPYVISNILYILVLILTKNYNIKLITLIKDILGINIINRYTWYINDLLLTYLIFYILFVIQKKKNFIKNNFLKYFSSIILTYLILIILKLNNQNLSFISFDSLSLSLFIGMLLGLNKTYNNNQITNKNLKYILLELIIILHFIPKPNEIMNRIISIIIIPILTSLITQYKFSFNNLNNLLETLGKYSLEIYLLHIPILILFRNSIIYITNQSMYTILYLITLTISTYIFKKITLWLNSILNARLVKGS